MNRESFIFYKSFYEASKFLENEEKWKLFDMICQYWLYGNEIEWEWASMWMFLLIKPQLDANNKRYINWCKWKEFWEKWWAPKWNQNAVKNWENDIKQPQNNPKTTPNDNDNVNDNIKENNNENSQEQSQDTNNSIPKQKDSNTLSKHSELDFIKNSDDIRDIFNDDEIAQHKIQLKIILKMVELWYKVKKSKSDIEKEFERLKAKAKLYWLIQWDWNIARTTFYQKIDKRFDWHTEKWKKVKNFNTSIIPFISK